MLDGTNHNCHSIDRDALPDNFPTHLNTDQFWTELGRAVATFGFIEQILSQAIYALTGTKKCDLEADPEALADWIKRLEKVLKDQLGGLIVEYEKALAENERTKDGNFGPLIQQLKDAKDLRNVLCHSSWQIPDENGRVVPVFVNRNLMVFQTPVDIEFLEQTRKATLELVCDVMDSVTMAGYQWPNSGGPGEQAITLDEAVGRIGE
jgi:hypothetical protein